jgi:hypothetical protein
VTYAATTEMPLCRRLRYAYQDVAECGMMLLWQTNSYCVFGGSNHIHASINLVLRMRSVCV